MSILLGTYNENSETVAVFYVKIFSPDFPPLWSLSLEKVLNELDDIRPIALYDREDLLEAQRRLEHNPDVVLPDFSQAKIDLDIARNFFTVEGKQTLTTQFILRTADEDNSKDWSITLKRPDDSEIYVPRGDERQTNSKGTDLRIPPKNEIFAPTLMINDAEGWAVRKDLKHGTERGIMCTIPYEMYSCYDFANKAKLTFTLRGDKVLDVAGTVLEHRHFEMSVSNIREAHKKFAIASTANNDEKLTT